MDNRPSAIRIRRRASRVAFTLIELLVVISIIALLVGMLLPALSKSRTTAKTAVCLSRLRTLGQGVVLYANANRDALPPGRMPAVNDDQTRNQILGGIKYRPTFLAMIGNEVGLPAFEEPRANKTEVDRFGQPGDRQNYASPTYICSETPDWLDERNGSYGYNYQFLGNSRLYDTNVVTSWKNWPVGLSSVRSPAECVGVADSMGTAATFPRGQRRDYQDDLPNRASTGRDEGALGNEGFNLDPPHIDLDRGEAAGFDDGFILRTAVHERHGGKAATLWMDVHASPETNQTLGYQEDANGAIGLLGDNRLFSADHTDRPWKERP